VPACTRERLANLRAGEVPLESSWKVRLMGLERDALAVCRGRAAAQLVARRVERRSRHVLSRKLVPLV